MGFSIMDMKHSPLSPREPAKQVDGETKDFECNICLEVAKEPVVTSCGHLFCWPCLYQWLHLHSQRKDQCPVCNGDAANVVPIYGSRVIKKRKIEEESCLDIPPRPQGNHMHRYAPSISPLVAGRRAAPDHQLQTDAVPTYLEVTGYDLLFYLGWGQIDVDETPDSGDSGGSS